ncbi:MAG TPA: CSLREA domain-containing protein [Anaerolineae bacterium]|nr:CSLREA domain-containing protein [Anaerolineae bacterium]
MNKKVLLRILTLLFVLGFMVSVGVVMATNLPQADMQTITVDTTVDDLIDNGNCSLREAIQAANTGTAVDACPAGGMTTTIMIPAGTYSLTIPGAHETENVTGDMNITANVTIVGAGAGITILNANGLDRFFFIHPNSITEISGVTITGGFVDGYSGGGIYVAGTLDLQDAVVTENVATTPSSTGGGLGGGIIIWEGEFTANNIEISRNSAKLSGGGLYVRSSSATIHNALIQENSSIDSAGGGIRNGATEADSILTITDSHIISNTSGNNGGGIGNTFNSGRLAMTSLERVTISGNSAVVGSDYLSGLGGGIGNGAIIDTSSGSGIINVRHSTIRNNMATNGGGIGSTPVGVTGPVLVQVTVENSVIEGNIASGDGFQVGNGGGILSLDGVLTVRNSTISGNQATGSGSQLSGLGGGVLVAAQVLPATTSLVATTISENTAALVGNGVANANLGGGSTVEFKNTLVADNGALNCFNNGGVMTSLGYNLDSQDACSFNQGTDLVNTSPMLGNLTAENGTIVYPLLAESPAIDSGSCTDENGDPITVDQRGMSRPQGVTCDIGAYEVATTFNTYLPMITK